MNAQGMMDAMTGKLDIPAQLLPAVVALVAEYTRLQRDRDTGELCLRLQVTAGGIRDKTLSYSRKI